MKHINIMETKLETNELDELINIVRNKVHESENSPWLGLYKGILSKLIKMFDESFEAH